MARFLPSPCSGWGLGMGRCGSLVLWAARLLGQSQFGLRSHAVVPGGLVGLAVGELAGMVVSAVETGE